MLGVRLGDADLPGEDPEGVIRTLKANGTSPGVSWGSFRKPFSVPVTVNPLAPGISRRRVFPWGHRQASSLTRLSRQDKNFSARNRQVETMLQVAHCRHIFTDP